MERWWYAFGLGLLVIAGAFFRLSYLARAGTDGRYFGGLWVGFVEAIREQSYALPFSIEHVTAAGTPFAYPPLAFYAALILSDITGLDPLFYVNVLPGLVSVISLLAFYWLTSSLTSDKLQRFLLFAAFTFLITAYHEQHVPSGLAEAFGTLTLIVFTKCLLNLRETDSRRNIVIAGMVGAIAILASPGSAVAVFLIASAVWLTTPMMRSNLRQSALLMGSVLGMSLVLSSWFWLVVMLRHGPDIFFSVFSDRVGDGNLLVDFAESYVRKLVEFNIGGIEILGGIALIGLLELVRRRQFMVPLWLAAMFLVPQESSWLVSIPAAIAFGFGLWSIIHILTLTFDRTPPVFTKVAVTGTGLGLLLILPVYELIDSDIEVLSAAEIDLMEASKIRSDASDLFLIVLSDEDSRHNFLEWFPFHADRTVLNQRWGAEFTSRARELDLINDKLQECQTISCVAQTDLLDEGDPGSRRYAVVHPGIVADQPEYNVLYTNAAGSLIELR